MRLRDNVLACATSDVGYSNFWQYGGKQRGRSGMRCCGVTRSGKRLERMGVGYAD